MELVDECVWLKEGCSGCDGTEFTDLHLLPQKAGRTFFVSRSLSHSRLFFFAKTTWILLVEQQELLLTPAQFAK